MFFSFYRLLVGTLITLIVVALWSIWRNHNRKQLYRNLATGIGIWLVIVVLLSA